MQTTDVLSATGGYRLLWTLLTSWPHDDAIAFPLPYRQDGGQRHYLCWLDQQGEWAADQVPAQGRPGGHAGAELVGGWAAIGYVGLQLSQVWRLRGISQRKSAVQEAHVSTQL